MGRILGNISQPSVLSRYVNLAVALELVIDGAVHLNEKLFAGVLLGKIVSSGKYRAYAEGTVKSGGAFSASADTFTLEQAAGVDLMKNFRVGDVITSSSGTALGTIATFDPVTGVGTLTGNSANALTAGNKVIISSAVLSIAKADVRVLKSETLLEDGVDAVGAGWNEGFFNTAMVLGATSAALTAMSAKTVSSTEFRI